MTHSVCDSDGDSRWLGPRLVDPVVGRPDHRCWLGSRHRLRSRAERARGWLVWRGQRSGWSGVRARVAKGLRVPRAAERPLAEQSALATLRTVETVVAPGWEAARLIATWMEQREIAVADAARTLAHPDTVASVRTLAVAFEWPTVQVRAVAFLLYGAGVLTVDEAGWLS